MLLFVFVAAACGNDSNNDHNTAENDINNNQGISNNEENDNNQESNDPSDDNNDANVDTDDEANENGEEGQENQSSEDNEWEVDDDASVEDQLKDLSFKIFEAQREENYDFLESFIAEGVSMDEDANMFHFEGEYEHDMEFVQEPADNLEYRYVHESDGDTVYVGYGVIDNETESSYTIDFEFIQLEGEWKMKDMDKNA